ncbi:carbamoyltransferase C-terminal domain-containing protein (plasmid) [Aggregatilineales bacterium SYSU G02658]
MAVILGINTHHAGSSAALVIDGIPVAAVAEERLNRVKYYAGFPRLSILKVMEIANVQFKDIDYVALGRDESANLNKKLEYVIRNPTKLLNLARMRSARFALGDLKTLIATECGANPNDLRFEQVNVEHHLAHIASAYFISPWDHAAGFSMDGSGDFVTCMLAECKGQDIEVKKRIYVPHSLGSLYAMVCQFIGYGKYGDEGKVMGLAPYGQPTYLDTFRDMVAMTKDGFTLTPHYFLPFGSNQGIEMNEKGEMEVLRQYSDHMVTRFGPPREPYSEITQRDMDMAFCLQQVFEDVYMHMLNMLHQLVPTERVAMAGGAVLNSVANGKMFDQTPFRETCIQPAAGDEGLSLGAALYVSQTILREKQRFVMKDAYLGPEFSHHAMKAALDAVHVEYKELERDDLLQATADQIEQGKVVGWFQGRMEWGPRALGNRSILAHPGRSDMKDVLNARIKRREWFRPFAPVVLAEQQDEIFEHTHPSPFMLHVYKIKPEWHDRLTAVRHVDDTGRLQTVSRDENPLYYDLVKTFGERTGIPVLINTSFNENEPIICTPQEAVDCFLRTKMDTLVLGNFFCVKNDEA